jgi:type I restriction enzyme, S subunit
MKLPTVKVGDICDLVNGKAFKPEDWSTEGEPIIRIQNLNDAEKPFNYWNGPLDRQVLVKTGDVLLAWSGTPGTSFGAHIWSGPSGVLNQHIFRVDIDRRCITREWCVLAINHKLNTLIDQAHGGVGLKHVTRGMVDSLEIPLPPLGEQRRIAAILDQADALRRKRQEAIDMLDAVRKATFADLFGDLSHGEIRHSVRNLIDVCTLIRDGTHKTPNYVPSGVPFVTVKNITSGSLNMSSTKFISEDEYFEITRKSRPERGDILVSKDGTIGIPCVIDTDDKFAIFVSVALLKLRTDLVDSQFLAEQLRTEWLQRQIKESSKGIAIRHLHLGDFNRLKVIVPTMKEQKIYSKFYNKIRTQEASMSAHMCQVEALLSSLQHRAFRGEL